MNGRKAFHGNGRRAFPKLKYVGAALCCLTALLPLAGCASSDNSGKIEIEIVQYKPEAANYFKTVEEQFNRALSSSILSSPGKAWIGVMIVCAWQAIAMNTIIYISGLQTVPEDVYEAGGLDGATGWKQLYIIRRKIKQGCHDIAYLRPFHDCVPAVYDHRDRVQAAF